MPANYTIVLLLILSIILTSATPIKTAGYTSQPNIINKEISVAKGEPYKYKIGFLDRLLLKLALKTASKIDAGRPDKLAKTSLGLGIGAWGAIILGIVLPGITLASIPLAIAAYVTGKQALKQGTLLEGKAKLGKGLGLSALITLIVVSIIFIIVLAALLATWN